MNFRFLHFADVHLGYRQYGLSERADDFARALLHVVDAAIQHKVDFVILSGDLFHKRAIDALTLNQAFRSLERLAEAAIPVIAVEGNHELAHYGEGLGWLQFLAQRRLINLLKPEFHEGTVILAPYENRRGSYLDVLPGVRVHGLRYMGAATAATLPAYAEALQGLPGDGVKYTIFVAHTGVEGVVDGDIGSPTLSQWNVLRPVTDYIALGHIHKPFQIEEWLHNPGSLETVAHPVDLQHQRGGQ
jgi:DNA repair exonuclease SbcCD nuclease subunit